MVCICCVGLEFILHGLLILVKNLARLCNSDTSAFFAIVGHARVDFWKNGARSNTPSEMSRLTPKMKLAPHRRKNKAKNMHVKTIFTQWLFTKDPSNKDGNPRSDSRRESRVPI